MTIAVPVWNENVSPVLDTAEQLRVFTIENGRIVDHRDFPLGISSTREKSRIIADNAEMLVCGALSAGLAMMLEETGIAVYPWVMGNAEQLVATCAGGCFPGQESVMPGCREWRHRGRKRCGNPRDCGNHR